MRAEHINITIPTGLRISIDKAAGREHIGRSTFIQKAVTFYLYVAGKRELRKLLVEGYAEMDGESRKITREFDPLDREAMKYVD